MCIEKIMPIKISKHLRPNGDKRGEEVACFVVSPRDFPINLKYLSNS